MSNSIDFSMEDLLFSKISFLVDEIGIYGLFKEKVINLHNLKLPKSYGIPYPVDLIVNGKALIYISKTKLYTHNGLIVEISEIFKKDSEYYFYNILKNLYKTIDHINKFYCDEFLKTFSKDSYNLK